MRKLQAEELRRRCDPQIFDFKTNPNIQIMSSFGFGLVEKASFSGIA